jgi:dihydroorotate dehydrogenase (NAD+) catalytic subunit
MSTNFPAPSLEFKRPLMNAAGSLGFAPDPRGSVSTEHFGAFVTNPISVRARRAANPPSMLPFPGGVLLHTGFPNPGVSSAIKQYSAGWARASLPIIVHLLSAKAEELHKAILRLEELENVISVELGFEEDSSGQLVADLVEAATGELPLIAQLPITRALELAETALGAGASAISLGPPRGALAGKDGKVMSGRLYGPAIFPQALEVVRQLGREGVSVIGAGGVESEAQAEAMLEAGATAVQVDVSLWKGY